MTLAIIMPKLYANTVYMVLNSRIRIMGGRDTYTSSTDMELTTTLIVDTTPHPMQGTQRTDGVQGQVTVVTITKEVFSSDHEMSRTSVSHIDSRALLELIFLQGETTGRQYESLRVTIRVHSLSPPRSTIFDLVVIHTETNSNLIPLCANVFRSLYIYSYINSCFLRLSFQVLT